MSDIETVKAALETCPDWEATRDANEALVRLLSRARAEALEEAAALCETAAASRSGVGRLTNGGVFASRIRAIAGTTPAAFVPAERVREALHFIRSEAGCSDVVRIASERLGVPLDDDRRPGDFSVDIESMKMFDTRPEVKCPRGAEGPEHCRACTFTTVLP